jgi:glycosyltransferase involved in cell wall biosynthesis
VAIDHIAICTVGELFGGVERHVLGMMSELARKGISVLLILFHDGELAAQARAMGVTPVLLPSRNLAVFITARSLARVLKGRRTRVVHVHGYKATVFCAIARHWHRFAIVRTEHGLREPTASPLGAWRDRLYHVLDDIATRAAGAAVCYVTEDLRTQRRHAHAGLRTTVIPNGIACMERQRHARPPEFGPGRFNLAAVGRLEPVKALHLAIEALCVESMPANVHLHIVGTGSCESELREHARATGVHARVHFLGFRRDACDFIAHCDALVIPSLHEGLPYTLLEAMALGTPVIASRVGGLAEVLQDRVTGLLVAPRDATAVAGAIRRLLSEQPLRARLGDEAKRVQRAKYSLESMASSYLDVYRETLASSG